MDEYQSMQIYCNYVIIACNQVMQVILLYVLSFVPVSLSKSACLSVTILTLKLLRFFFPYVHTFVQFKHILQSRKRVA